MVQVARPDSDISNAGKWTLIDGTTQTGLWAAMDDNPSDDTDYIRRASPDGLLLALGLSNVLDPASSTGHILRYRYEKSAADPGMLIDLTLALVCGATTIATYVHTNIPGPATGWTAATQTLTGPQADAITDYNDLRLHISATNDAVTPARQARVSWFEFEVPDGVAVVYSLRHRFQNRQAQRRASRW